jgi:hypothetical protein
MKIKEILSRICEINSVWLDLLTIVGLYYEVVHTMHYINIGNFSVNPVMHSSVNQVTFID